MDIKEELNTIFDPGNSLLEMPIAMECGQLCNSILGVGLDIHHRKGAVIGGLLGGPFGMIYGGARPANTLHALCKAKCKLDKKIKMKAPRHEINAAKTKVKIAENKVKGWITKFKPKEPQKSAIMQKAMRVVLGKRF